MTHQEALQKVAKLLRLSKSSNPNEAALAAQAMDRVKKQEEKDKAALLLAAKNIMKRRNR